jgi:hypothetical protein
MRYVHSGIVSHARFPKKPAVASRSKRSEHCTAETFDGVAGRSVDRARGRFCSRTDARDDAQGAATELASGPLIPGCAAIWELAAH